MKQGHFPFFLMLSVIAHAIAIWGIDTNISQRSLRLYSLEAGKVQVKKIFVNFVQTKETVNTTNHGSKKKVKSKKLVPTKSTAEKTIKKVNNQSFGQSDSVAKYLSTVRAMVLQNKHYPKVAKKLRQQGKVSLYFEIHWPNKIENIGFKQRSPYEILNNSALDAVKALKALESLPPMPPELKSQRLEVAVPLDFKII